MDVLGRELRKVSYLVLDLETTGLSHADDRVVEIAAYAWRPGEAPRLMLDTLVDPQRPIPAEASKVHGIHDADVQGAPTFGQLAAALISLMSSRVVVAHNAAFDVGMLKAEFRRLSRVEPFPYLCTMRLPKLLGFGDGNWPLWWACQQFGTAVPRNAHAARDDAEATCGLLHKLVERSADITFRELATTARRLKLWDDFLNSVGSHLVPAPPRIVHAGQLPLRPRQGNDPDEARPDSAAQRYLDAVLAAVEDLRLTPAERERLIALRSGLSEKAIEQVHHRIWHSARRRHRESGYVEAREADREARLRQCLVELGYRPWP
ncbi:MAG: hypothetical protein H6702_12720 [Myxococcales bacterium]|nr:hypothetical protein [Myxococcales bacterium]